jgi:hypothetical protein
MENLDCVILKEEYDLNLLLKPNENKEKKLFFSKAPFYCYDYTKILISKLIDNNWIEKEYIKGEKYDFCDSSIVSKIINNNNRSYIWTNKYHLYNILRHKKYIPDTYPIINGNWIETIPQKKNTVFFLKNILTDANRDNYIYNNLDDIEMHTKNNPKKVYIVQPSIENLLLINNKKFDIRIMGVLITQNNIDFDFYILKQGLIRKTFNDFNNNNLDIDNHITTSKSNIDKSNKTIFNNKFNNYNIIFDNIVKICNDFFNQSIHQFKQPLLYNEKMIWNIGLDFIVDKNYNVFLLEINHNPGGPCIKALGDIFYTYLAKYIYTPLAMNKRPIIDDSVLVRIN